MEDKRFREVQTASNRQTRHETISSPMKSAVSDFIRSIIMSIHQRLSIDEIPQCWAGSSFCCDNTELGWTEPISRAKTALPSLELISRPVIRGGWGGDTSRLGLSSA